MVRFAILAAALSACGDDTSAPTPEVVVSDASLGGTTPKVLGATATDVFWSASSGSNTLIGGASLASLPVQGGQLATASGPVVHAGNYVLFEDAGTLSRVGGAATIQRLTTAAPEWLSGSSAEPPVAAWTVGPVLSWGADDAQMTASFTKIDSCDHAYVSTRQLYVACDGASGRRLLRVDQRSGEVAPMTASSTWAAMFPGSGMAGSTYRGRVVGGDDESALWLVEEMPSKRGILVSQPVQGEPAVLLEHLVAASGFFVTADALYWQENDALLSAPRAGGVASIVATDLGTVGAIADGYAYFTHGVAIERLRVE